MVKKIRTFIDSHMTLIKFVFVFSVFIFVIRQLIKIVKEVRGEQLHAVLADQSPLNIGIMLVLGLISILPMMVYDFSIVQFLPTTFKKSYILKSGWVVNTFTNLLGFGGLLGASLRANFYGKKVEKKQIIYAISKVALFLVAGLSLLCMVSLAMIFGFGIGSQYSHYFIWLIGGALYFPIMFLFTRLNQSSFFDDLSVRQELTMTTGSFFEWGSALGFFLMVGYLMGISTNFAAIIPLFVVANVAGVVSLIPGGIGSFDVFMIIGLGFVGVGRSDALVWIMLYRLFYYLIPFIIGVGLFIHETGSSINEYLDGLPKVIIQRFAQIVLTVFMYFSGIMMLLFATIPTVVVENKVYLKLFPYTIFFVSHLTNIIMAFLLIGLANGIWARTKRAFIPTVIVLIGSIGYTVLNESFTWRMILVLIISLVVLALSKGGLYRERMTTSWGMVTLNGAIFVSTFMFYAWVGLSFRHHRVGFNNAFLFPSEGAWLVGFVGLIVAVVVWIGLTRYLAKGSPSWFEDQFDEQRVEGVLNEFGGNENSHLAFLRDKNIYFYQEDGHDQIFFMYKQFADKLVIMGEPVGNSDKVEAAVDDFMTQADRYDYKLVFYEVNQETTMTLHEKGFDFIKTGEDGLVDVQNFTLAGKRHRGERALVNKFDREGYTFEIIEPPFSDDVFDRLETISKEWLAGKSEKGFSLGFFDRYYLEKAPVAVMRNADGRIVAFANLMPSDTAEYNSIDLMRSSSDAPSGAMDGIFIKLYDHSKEQGYRYFDLGMSPLSNVGTSRFSFIQERVVHLIYKYGYRLYSFEGLRTYKEKYVDEWKPKYISYFRGSSLAFTVLQIMSLVNQRVGERPKSKLRFRLISMISSISNRER
ncbi:bifunctional lysylphosphatidylglycerol flippase/synthetase MprF [Lentilactobacillus sp. Marseille-Q4993]|uniref:bifunctional lysylphosphatidylglycerol flippase/synthetase MprF n=1 Tax=Lentilactobacillus sp. Marseille-Q4993 TaxID=3039492 RepID=UPI0024BC2CFF|nr:bifunctional lysylphosphatidylglycerol flippase/synthetase MprF [Lentilactobacillus sp. Marseille-Q4993]